MSSSSNSTQLINCLIALSTKNPDFPYPLWENGFQIETIEPRILLSDTSQANPDIQFKRNNDALLFFECKDGHCEKNQLERYKKLTIEDIKRHHITSLTSPDLFFDLAYFTSKQKEEKIIQSVEKDGNPFPILILEESAIKFNPKSNKFKNSLLNSILNEIPIKTRVPQNFIPFMVDDDDKTILCALLQHFIQKNFIIKTEYQFTLDELLEELFLHLIHHYSPQARAELKGRLGKLLKILMEKDEFLGKIVRREDVYYVLPHRPRSFMKSCQKLITEMKDEILKEDNKEIHPQLTFENF